MLPSSRDAFLACALLLACAAPKESWRQPAPEVFVDVVPRAAQLLVDGAPFGAGAARTARRHSGASALPIAFGALASRSP